MVRSASSYASNTIGDHSFGGPLRQRGAGFGALALGVGRVALPLIKRYGIPLAKDLLRAAAPELLSVVEGKTKRKQAIKNVLRTTIKKQLGGARKKRRVTSTQTRKRVGTSRRKAKTKKTSTSRRKSKVTNKRTKRKRNPGSRDDFFSAIGASARV